MLSLVTGRVTRLQRSAWSDACRLIPADQAPPGRDARAAEALTRYREPVTWTAAARLYDRMSEAPTAEVRPYERDRAMPPATQQSAQLRAGFSRKSCY